MNKEEKIQTILSVVAETTGVSESDIFGEERKTDYVLARFIISHELKLYGLSASEIGRVIHRNHATIIHHLRKYRDEYNTNPSFRDVSDDVSKRCSYVINYPC